MRNTIKKAFCKFVHESLIILYIYSAGFWIVSLGARVFFNSPKVTEFFLDVAAPTTLTVLIVALVHWWVTYRNFIKNYPDNYKD